MSALEQPPFIYALVDPREPDHLRYVGMTMCNPNRPYHHKKRARSRTHLAFWLEKLKRECVEYDVVILERCDPNSTREYLGERERYHIKKAKNEGHRLVNGTDGGDGGVTRRGPVSLEEHEKIKQRNAARRGIPRSAETREKIGIAHRGRKATPEARAALSAAMTSERRAVISEQARKQCTPEHLAKMNDAKRGKTWSEKRRAAQTADVTEKIRQAKLGKDPWNKGNRGGTNEKLKGRAFSPETIERMRTAALARHAREKAESESA